MESKRRCNVRWPLVLGLIAATAVATLAAATVLAQRGEQAPSAQLEHARSLSTAFREAAQKSVPTVVTIEGRPETRRLRRDPRRMRPDRNPFEGTPFEDFFNDDRFRFYMDEMPPSPSLGSGVIIDAGGVILTNNHVVASNGEMTVRLHDGREFPVKEVKTDPGSDLAIIRIEGARNLQAAELGDSDTLEIGDWVLAVGSPFGWETSVTAGIISARGRRLHVRGELLQTDAAINRGNSGGPLVSLDGKVIGINTAISTSSGGYQGVGFAIPINQAKWVVRQLVEHGSVRRAYLGIQIQPVDNNLAEQFGVPVGEGALAADVLPSSPAAEAGVMQGDVILEFGGEKVRSPAHLQSLVERMPLDSRQPLLIVRDGKRVELQVMVRQQPEQLARAEAAPEGPRAQSEGTAFEELGIEVSPLTPEVAEKLGINETKGVVITAVEPGSSAGFGGLQRGMVIVEVGRQPVGTVEDFRKAMEKQSLEKGILFLVRASDGSRFVVIRHRR
ncbi:MAG: Do family serine endopeptidase [Planctomycetes bacterium]|nr:Do family serine endopeptidase [Planctomycetota bacterium]